MVPVAASVPAAAPAAAPTESWLLRNAPENIVGILEDLQADALRVLELMREWDEDRNGATDVGEFRIALPVLDIGTSRAEADAVFEWLLAEATQRSADHGFRAIDICCRDLQAA